jgi:hypothetical protein
MVLFLFYIDREQQVKTTPTGVCETLTMNKLPKYIYWR